MNSEEKFDEAKTPGLAARDIERSLIRMKAPCEGTVFNDTASWGLLRKFVV